MKKFERDWQAIQGSLLESDFPLADNEALNPKPDYPEYWAFAHVIHSRRPYTGVYPTFEE